MRPGSVIVDLAAEAGGNCELTEPGEEVVREGVTLVGPTNLPSTMPFHASQLYARNVFALLHHLAPEGELGARLGRRDHRRRLRDPQAGGAGVSHDTLLVFELTILVLAIFLGFEVISKVPTLLHTPLMSGTNAIHGIVIVGAMLVLGARRQGHLRRGSSASSPSCSASANVVGGFVVTDRMLEMFKRREPERAAKDDDRDGRHAAVSRTTTNLLYLVTIVTFILALRFLSQPDARPARQPDRRGRDARRDRRHLRAERDRRATGRSRSGC